MPSLLRSAAQRSRSRATLLCHVLLVSVFARYVYGGSTPDVEVIVESASTTVASCDTVLLKVTIRNTGRSALRVRPGLAAVYGTVQVQVKMPDEVEFRDAPLRGQGKRCVDSHGTRIAPGAAHATFEMLFATDRLNAPLFAEAGEYQLRATVLVCDDPQSDESRDRQPVHRVTSEPLLIRVTASPATETAAISAMATTIYGLLPDHGAAPQTNKGLLQQVHSNVSIPQLRRTLDFLLGLEELRQTVDRTIRLGLVEDLVKTTETMDDNFADYFRLLIARELYSMDESDRMETLLQTVDESFYVKDILQQQLMYRWKD
jgi:hypothetical protein